MNKKNAPHILRHSRLHTGDTVFLISGDVAQLATADSSYISRLSELSTLYSDSVKSVDPHTFQFPAEWLRIEP